MSLHLVWCVMRHMGRVAIMLWNHTVLKDNVHYLHVMLQLKIYICIFRSHFLKDKWVHAVVFVYFYRLNVFW